MQTITFRASRRGPLETNLAFGGTLIGSLGLAHLVVILWVHDSPAERWSQDPLELLQFAGYAIVGFSVGLTFWFRIPKRWLQLDDEGLTYAEGRTRTRRWRWDELSAFRPWRRWTVLRIAFVVTGQSNRSVRLARKLDLPRQGLLVQIEDVYDTPIDEIAAALNDYRERALAGGNREPEQSDV